ncbi:hypothetical protein PTKIN_Ptkin16aG0013000 [Pterospermum kingtungense]
MVLDKTGPAWNKGRIHYTGAPKEVCKAYLDQFAKDIDSFLNARAKELSPGGLMALIIPALPDVVSHPQVTIGSELELGIVSKANVDAFNVPLYFTSPKQLQQIIEGNGCFSIERMDILDNPKHHRVMPHLGQRAQYIRAILEMLIVKHFGAEIIDQLFEIYARKLSESTIFLNPEYRQSSYAALSVNADEESNANLSDCNPERATAEGRF